VLIRLNGEPHVLDEPLTITQLLERLHIDPRRVAVERNLIVVKRQQYPDTWIHEGDEIEIVNFVGGGLGQ
jgi:thiamine biosynthesis protein ThiS